MVQTLRLQKRPVLDYLYRGMHGASVRPARPAITGSGGRLNGYGKYSEHDVREVARALMGYRRD